VSNLSSFYSQFGTGWLLALGQRLRVEYDQTAEPLPPRLVALLEQLDAPPRTGVQNRMFAPSARQQRSSSGSDDVAAATQL